MDLILYMYIFITSSLQVLLSPGCGSAIRYEVLQKHFLTILQKIKINHCEEMFLR